jgi:hypothetical protein
MIYGGHSGFGDQGNSATYTIEVNMASNQESSQGGGKGQENNKNKEIGGAQNTYQDGGVMPTGGCFGASSSSDGLKRSLREVRTAKNHKTPRILSQLRRQ